MKNTEPPEAPVKQTLLRAGLVYSRQRALSFLLRSTLIIVAAIPLLMLADVLFHFSDNLRLTGAITMIVAIISAIIICLWIGYFTHPPILRIARLLEERNPALGSKLVNILELEADAAAAESSSLTRLLAIRAIEDSSKSLNLSELPSLAREPKLPRHALNLSITVALLAALTWIGGHHVKTEWLRFIDPYGDHPPFSLTRLEILKPGVDDQVLYGGSFTVEARASGHQPDELFLTAKALNDSATPITLPMSARGDGTFVTRLENIIHPLQLTAHTRNYSSRSHHKTIHLILTPQYKSAKVTVTPPAYTGIKAREMAYRFTALQLLEGTKIDFEIQSNRPLGNGHILFEYGGEKPDTFELKPSSETSTEIARATMVVTSSGRMTFSLIDELGNASNETPTAALTVTRDQPPTIVITTPENDGLVVENFSIPIMVDATDDFGLKSMRLHIGINDKYLPIDPVLFTTPDVHRNRIEHKLDLAAHGMKAGDQITIFAEAIDTRPEPQITRTNTRRIEVITEQEYNNLLRQEVDVAKIAGKYENLLRRFDEMLAEQKRIEEKFAGLREKTNKDSKPEDVLNEFSHTFAEQFALNESLEELAEEMENFGRDNPVYDFEKELSQKLREQSDAIRQSIEQNHADNEKALAAGPLPPEAPNSEMMEGMEKSAREQLKRLEGEANESAEEILEPLDELAKLHELMKDFNLFKELAEKQKEFADQSKAYEDKQNLNAEDRLALRDIGAKQREMARELENLARKLRQDAEAAKEKFPEAANSAEQLAEQMDAAAMPNLAREAANQMLEAQADEAHASAEKLQQEMERLFQDQAQQGQKGIAQGLDQALKLQRGMNAGDTLKQMMLSRNFRPLPHEGKSGNGPGGMLSSNSTDAQAMLMGGETMMDGPIANSIAGRGDGAGLGLAGGPTAKLDQADKSNVETDSSRRTTTPNSSTLLMEYENIADAYFRRLTTKP